MAGSLPVYSPGEVMLLYNGVIWSSNYSLDCIFRDGITRCGIYLTASIAWEKLKAEGEIDIFNTVKVVKTNRPPLVPNLVSKQSNALRPDCQSVFLLFMFRFQRTYEAIHSLVLSIVNYYLRWFEPQVLVDVTSSVWRWCDHLRATPLINYAQTHSHTVRSLIFVHAISQLTPFFRPISDHFYVSHLLLASFQVEYIYCYTFMMVLLEILTATRPNLIPINQMLDDTWEKRDKAVVDPPAGKGDIPEPPSTPPQDNNEEKKDEEAVSEEASDAATGGGISSSSKQEVILCVQDIQLHTSKETLIPASGIQETGIDNPALEESEILDVRM